MIFYSAHAIADLGSQQQCESLDANSTYVQLVMNVSTTPVFFRQGLCLPESCSQDMYNKFSKKVTNKITNGLRKLLAWADIHVYIAPPDVVMQVSLVKASTILKTATQAEAMGLNTQSMYHSEEETSLQPGIYYLQVYEPMFWVIISILALWIAFVLVSSIMHWRTVKTVRVTLKEKDARKSLNLLG